MTLRLLQDLETHAQSAPDAPAVQSVGPGEPVRFNRGQLRDVVGKICEFCNDLPREGTVLLHYPNQLHYIGAFLGVLAADRTLFPVAADAAGAEVADAASRSGAVAAIVDETTTAALRSSFRVARPLPALSPGTMLLSDPVWNAITGDGPALLLHSSGTTAEPKIVRRDGASLDAVTRNMIRDCGFGEGDHVLSAVPLCHSYGLEHGLLAPIGAGSCVHVCERFNLPSIVHELCAGGITLLPGVPFMFEMLNKIGNVQFPNLRMVYSAGAPLSRATFDAFEHAFGLRIGQVFGATEIGSVTFNDPDGAEFNKNSVGRPMEGVSIKILDPDDPQLSDPLEVGKEGLVAVRAPSMLSGYVGEQETPLIDGYFLTGDLGTLEERGELTITGRMKLLIDIGGRKVNPLEVESVLRRHPDVGACVVLPMRLSETVQRLKAIITPARPDIEISVNALRQFARSRLSGYKVPRVFEIRPSLPTSPAGKVLRRLVETP
jgi:acyl-CoA synthetase (AMP-forming)/AMP-acid ligase II